MALIKISNTVSIQDSELEWQFIRSSGAGGQHLNKVSTAAQLIFDINQSSLPDFYRARLLAKADHRITKSGKIIIKCQQSRSQDFNRQTALEQFITLVASVAVVQKNASQLNRPKAANDAELMQKNKKVPLKPLGKTKVVING